MGVRGRKAKNENKGGGKVEEGTEKGRKETEYSYQRNGGNREKLNGRLIGRKLQRAKWQGRRIRIGYRKAWVDGKLWVWDEKKNRLKDESGNEWKDGMGEIER